MKSVLVPDFRNEMFFTSLLAEDRCIGHLRIDFGNGDEFWSSFFPHAARDKNVQSFRDDLAKVVNPLRKNLLKNISGMRKYMSAHPSGYLEDGWGGYKAETRSYEFFIRCKPQRGDYNCYIYCYVKE